jgi:hypothetical protein
MKEAHKHGLRAITNARWDALNEEYLVYKRSVVDELARAETHRPDQGVPDHERSEPTVLTSPHPHPQTQTQTQTTPFSP